ncbi:hypothetical protein B296_00053574 [Ensete ventricosum]|uniref:Uncharacterized protein n=1 Tax=Ensete ventricosum TaxID=4639 RepID=A0A426Y7H8_ENSVE|nr:hypothetical protein B296_00053574 [Ensete ventricosum]
MADFGYFCYPLIMASFKSSLCRKGFRVLSLWWASSPPIVAIGIVDALEELDEDDGLFVVVVARVLVH